MTAKESAVCKNCNKEFSYYRSTLRGKEAKYCSKKCYFEQISAWNKGIIEYVKCKFCGGKARKWRKYCSRDCYIKDTNFMEKLPKNLSGENNPAWKGGITLETRRDRNNFFRKTAKLIYKRDNYTCQICGIRGGKLNAHHIKKWSTNKELRFDINNCKTLCINCHYLLHFGKNLPLESKWGVNNLTFI